MPLFSRHAEPVQQQAPVHEEPPKRGLFGGRRSSPAPAPMNDGRTTRSTPTGHRTSPERGRTSGGIFRRSTDASNPNNFNTSSRDTSGHRGGGGGGGLLHRGFGKHNNPELDPSIVQAREHVMGAEAAEREAERALITARESIRSAQEEVRRLEIEAKEEARMAKIKQHHAKEVSKRGKMLGKLTH